MNNNLSLGNKTIGYISFFSTAIVVIVLVIQLHLYTTVAGVLLLTFYSFQAVKICYIKISDRHFVIENIFKRTVTKDITSFKKISTVGFGLNLMIMRFQDGSSYLFFGNSKEQIEERIIKYMNTSI